MLIKSQARRPVLFITIGLIIILGFVVYGNTLNNRFIWDDYGLIKYNKYLRSWSSLPEIFTKDIGAGSGTKAQFFRPLQVFTYLITYSFWGLNVRGYHLVNTLFHILVALNIYWLVNILYGKKLLSFLTSAFFVVHPLHTEAVAYISGLADPLTAFFILLWFILYVKQTYRESIGLFIFILLSYILALMSRENSIILPLLILLYHYIFKKRIKIKIFLSLLTITAVYVLFRLTVVKLPLASVSSFTDLFRRIPGFFVSITNYLRLLVLPSYLHYGYGYRLFSYLEPRVIFGITLVISSIVYAVIKREKYGLFSFSIFWFFITLLPASNIYPINDSYMLEHWLYLPSMGFFLILADRLCFFYNLKKFRIFTILLIIGMVVFYSSLTVRQNKYWRDPIDFYKRSLEYTPDNWRFYNELGIEYMNIGENEEAITSYKKALEINSSLRGVYYNLGSAYGAIGKNQEAVLSYQKALEIDPNYQEAYVNLGNIYRVIGKNKEAIASYNKALEINPSLGIAHNNLALTYYYEKQYSLAIEHCDKAMKLGYKVHPQLLEFLKPYRK